MKVFGRWTTFFLLVLLGIAIVQNNFLFLNCDVAELTQQANQVLHGGKYYNDFLEVNPPLILCLYMFPVWISNVFQISIIAVFAIYIFLLGLFSLCFCYLLLGKIFPYPRATPKNFLILITAFLFFIFPNYSFGQRDQLTFMLILPYILLVVLRVENQSVSIAWKILGGVMGGIGFAIKPYFLIPWLMVEIYLMIRKRNFFSWIRTETIMVILIFVFYLAGVFVFFPEYLFKVIPFVGPLFLSTMQVSWLLVFSQRITFFMLITLGVYFSLRETLDCFSFTDVLAVSSVGFYLVYLLQHTLFFYHQIPAFSFGILLAAVIIFKNSKSRGFSLISNLFFAVFLSTLVFLSFYEQVDYARRFKAEELQPMIKLLRQLDAKGSIYIFPSLVPTTYPLIVYAKIQSASRFGSFAILSRFEPCFSDEEYCQNQPKLLKEKNEIIRMVIEDFNKNKPSLVMVDERKEKPYFTVPFDYISFFSQSEQFRKIWKKYKHFTTLNGYGLYRRE